MPVAHRPTPLAAQIAAVPGRHDNGHPLEQVCWWYDEVTGVRPNNDKSPPTVPPMNYRTPFGLFNPLLENGLRRVETLFTELQ